MAMAGRRSGSVTFQKVCHAGHPEIEPGTEVDRAAFRERCDRPVAGKGEQITVDQFEVDRQALLVQAVAFPPLEDSAGEGDLPRGEPLAVRAVFQGDRVHHVGIPREAGEIRE